MIITQRRVRAGLAALSALILAACGGTANSDENGSGANPSESAVPETVRVALEASPGSMDPLRSGTFGDQQILYLYTGQLTALGAGEDSGQPELAESFTESEDGLTWTATLRPDLKFSDGSPLTSADVLASIDRVRNFLDGAGIPEFAEITEATTPDDRTIVFTLSRPRPSLPTILAQYTGAIYPEECLASGDSFFERPVSAGEYMVESADLASGRIVLVANPHYWGPQPEVKRVEFSRVPEAATRLAQLRNGDVDYVHNLPGELLPQVTDPMRTEAAHFPGGVTPIVLNHARELVADPRIRRAIHLAVDRPQISEVAVRGTTPPLYGPFPETRDISDASAPERNLDEARASLQGTVCETGCTFTLLVMSDFNWQIPETSLVVRDNLQEIGIEVDLVNVPRATMAERREQGDWDGYIGTNATMTAAIDVTAAQHFRSIAVGYSSPEMQQLVGQLETSPVDERQPILEDIERLFAQDLPYIPLTETVFVNATRLPEDVLSTTLGWVLELP